MGVFRSEIRATGFSSSCVRGILDDEHLFEEFSVFPFGKNT